MNKILSNSKTALVLLLVTVLSLGFYVYMLVRPISFAMDYHSETVYAGESFEGTIKFYHDNTMSFVNTNYDEKQSGFYYYQDGYVFLFTAKTEAEYEEEVAYIRENFEEAIQSPFYALKINAFKLGEGSAEEISLVYTCTSAITFAMVFGVIELALIALTCASLILCKKKKMKESSNA